jgi:enamine deaminase RidA (YjgF/YER057c/UK114 family)
MPKRIINPSHLAKPRGFNHAIATTGGEMLFLAGQDASDEQGKIVAPGDIIAQYEQVLRNLFVVMKEAGGTMQNIVKLNIYVTDREKYRARLAEMAEVHQAYFDNYYPAMALFEVNSLFQSEALIECEGIAVIEPGEPPSANT